MTHAVRIYNSHTTGKRVGHCNRPLAYLRYQGEHYCMHPVTAADGRAAKRIALREHKNCSDQLDPHCVLCGLAKMAEEKEVAHG